MKFEKELNKTEQGLQVIYRFKSKRIVLRTFPIPKVVLYGQPIVTVQHFHGSFCIFFRTIKGFRTVNFQFLSSKILRGERICGEFCRKHGSKQNA